MQEDLQRVLQLQAEYEPRASPAMKERGLLIRRAIPAWINEHADDLRASSEIDDFFAEGRDGTGLKTKVPWVRFGSRTRSPSATEGFYAVYLFDFQGEAVYLSLNQGTTDFRGGEFVRKPEEVILERRDWARSAVASWLGYVDGTSGIALHDPGLGAGYELGNVASLTYSRDGIPDDATLASDARLFAEGLMLLYREHATRPAPQEQPELREAQEAAERASGRTKGSSRAGFRTNSLEIKAIEVHAVAVARAYYEAHGFRVRELGKPFDLEVKHGDQALTVEVKGTTSDGTGVSLTAGEVAHHADAFPNNALVVVRNVVLHRDPASPTASGGELYELRAWEIDPRDLKVISYAYDVPPAIYDRKAFPATELG